MKLRAKFSFAAIFLIGKSWDPNVAAIGGVVTGVIIAVIIFLSGR